MVEWKVQYLPPPCSKMEVQSCGKQKHSYKMHHHCSSVQVSSRESHLPPELKFQCHWTQSLATAQTMWWIFLNAPLKWAALTWKLNVQNVWAAGRRGRKVAGRHVDAARLFKAEFERPKARWRTSSGWESLIVFVTASSYRAANWFVLQSLWRNEPPYCEKLFSSNIKHTHLWQGGNTSLADFHRC